MKELSIEEKAKAYDKALEVLYKYDGANIMFTQDLKEEMFPELVESEDKRIRKELINFCKIAATGQSSILIEDANQFNRWAAWLEKQGSEPNWCHHKVDLSDCSEEYRKAYYDGWNNCNVQHSQCKSELDDVLKCLINGMKFYYENNKDATWGTDKWSMPVKHIIEVLEKQGEQKPVEEINGNNGEISPNLKWSEEDELWLDNAIEACKAMYGETSDTIAWLKFLKERYTWKPSEEQIRVVARLRHCLLEDVRGNDIVILDNLLEQLKAL